MRVFYTVENDHKRVFAPLFRKLYNVFDFTVTVRWNKRNYALMISGSQLVKNLFFFIVNGNAPVSRHRCYFLYWAFGPFANMEFFYFPARFQGFDYRVPACNDVAFHFRLLLYSITNRFIYPFAGPGSEM
jgi:hypothetical protein